MTEKSETQKQTKNRQGVQGQKRGDTIWKPGKKKKKKGSQESVTPYSHILGRRQAHTQERTKTHSVHMDATQN